MKSANEIEYIVVNNTQYYADYYISSLSLETIVSLTADLKDVNAFKDLDTLEKKSRLTALSI